MSIPHLTNTTSTVLEITNGSAANVYFFLALTFEFFRLPKSLNLPKSSINEPNKSGTVPYLSIISYAFYAFYRSCESSDYSYIDDSRYEKKGFKDGIKFDFSNFCRHVMRRKRQKRFK